MGDTVASSEQVVIPLRSVLSENVERVGRRIRELREQRGWTQGQLAGFLGRTQTALSYWEAGKRAPGVDDLVELAGVFGVAVAQLMPTGPSRPLPTLLRAVAEEVDSRQLATELDEFVEAAAAVAAPLARWKVPATTSRDTAEALLAAAGVASPPVDVHLLADGCGVRVLSWAFSDVDGLVVHLEDGPVIGVNSGQHARRQRFTIAHELGHHLLRHAEAFHIDFGGDLSPATTGEHPDYDWNQEREANDFAANLLMPGPLVRAAYAQVGDLAAVAMQFNVSAAAMGFRLTNLRLR